ncbi:hypothetical protein HanIR_Chr13g0670451 [Helianthus annuus]|nr:hypothetical protein HanIR_Chr13g0670451 [Helianthus annuus]
MRVKYSPEPCARPEMTELLKSALVLVRLEARLVMVLTRAESRDRRWLKRDSGVALAGRERVSRWCRSRERERVFSVNDNCSSSDDDRGRVFVFG